MASYGFKIDLEGDALKKFQELYPQAEKFKLKVDEAHNSVSKLGEKVKGLGLSIKDLAIGGLGIGALFGGVEFAKASLEAFDKYEEGVAKVESALRSTGHAAGLTIDELKDSAKELSGQTLFDKSTIMDAQSMLLTFTSIRGEIFDKTIPAVADFATRFKMDMPEAANMLGKALNDPLKGMTRLQRQGVVFSDQQKETIKKFIETGQVAKAQEVILKELGKEFGGLAKAMANTDAGKIKMATKSLTDMKITIGEMLSKGLVAMSPMITKIGDAFKDAFGTKASDAMQKSRIEMMSMFDALKDHNISLDQRKELITALNTQYGDQITKTVTLSMTDAELGKVENDTNEIMLKRIDIQSNKEKYENFFKERQKAADLVRDKRMRMSGMNEETRLYLENINKENEAWNKEHPNARKRQITFQRQITPIPKNIGNKEAQAEYNAAVEADKWAAARLNVQLKQLKEATGFTGSDSIDTKKLSADELSKKINDYLTKLLPKSKDYKNNKDNLKDDALNTSALGGASGGLGEAKVIHIDFHAPLMKIDIPGGNGKDVVDKAPLAIEQLIRITNNLSHSQGATF